MRHDTSSRPDPDSAWKLVRTLEQPTHRRRRQPRAVPDYRIYRRVVAATISARAGRQDIARAEIARARRATQGQHPEHRSELRRGRDPRLAVGERARAEGLLRRVHLARARWRAITWRRDPYPLGTLSRPGDSRRSSEEGGRRRPMRPYHPSRSCSIRRSASPATLTREALGFGTGPRCATRERRRTVVATSPPRLPATSLSLHTDGASGSTAQKRTSRTDGLRPEHSV